MGQQVSPETALPFFRQRCSELQDENILLRARGAELERRVAELEQENSNLSAPDRPGPAPTYDPHPDNGQST